MYFEAIKKSQRDETTSWTRSKLQISHYNVHLSLRPRSGKYVILCDFCTAKNKKKRIMNCQRVSCALRRKDQQVNSNKWQKNLDQNCIHGWQVFCGDLSVCLLSSLLSHPEPNCKQISGRFSSCELLLRLDVKFNAVVCELFTVNNGDVALHLPLDRRASLTLMFSIFCCYCFGPG